MTTRDVRVRIMKNHIFLANLAKKLGMPPVELHRLLNDDNLSEEALQMINAGIDEVLETWKYGIYAESTESYKLLKPKIVEAYKKRKEKEKLNGIQAHEND